MSKLNTAIVLLKRLIEIKIPSKYNVFTEINPDGYDSPYILAIGHYEGKDTTSESRVNHGVTFQCEMGIGYNCDDISTTVTEELAIDLEKILTLSGIVKENNYPWEGQNQGSSVKYSEFKIKL